MSEGGDRAQAFTDDGWADHDWSIPTDLNTLRHRPYPAVDQSRYGHATTNPPRYGADGKPLPWHKQPGADSGVDKEATNVK